MSVRFELSIELLVLKFDSLLLFCLLAFVELATRMASVEFLNYQGCSSFLFSPLLLKFREMGLCVDNARKCFRVHLRILKIFRGLVNHRPMGTARRRLLDRDLVR